MEGCARIKKGADTVGGDGCDTERKAVDQLGWVARVWLSRDRFGSWEMGIAQLAKG
jgi:hypothetical protein